MGLGWVSDAESRKDASLFIHPGLSKTLLTWKIEKEGSWQGHPSVTLSDAP